LCTAAANEARAQAKAAADAAALQAQTAKAARDLAKAKLAETQKAEADAKAAAADAHAKRLAAEAEAATAKAEKETAAAKQAEAARHKENAQGYAQTADEAKGRAESAESTARAKRQDAEAARDRAKGKRDATESGCPKADTFYLGSQPQKGLSKKITYHFSFWEVEKAGLQSLGLFVANLAYGIIVEDFVQCYHKFTPSDDGGTSSGCAWAAATIIPVGKIAEALKAAKLVEDAIKTGRGAEKLLGDLKKLFGEKPSAADLADPDTLAGMALRLSERMADRAKAANSVDLDLVRKLEASGANFNRADVVMAVRYPRPGVPVAWLEIGNHKSGLVHIIFRHAGEFIEHGVASEDIPKLLNKALSEGKIVGQQGADGGRPIYETVYNGKTQRVAITVGNNGFIVGANPA
jgi:hypothetical protein